MTRPWRMCAVILAALAVAATMLVPSGAVQATAPPTTEVTSDGPIATNDLLPDANDLNNCVGTAEPANCGSRARADGHTYLVFIALAAGLTFIGWRISRGVRARDAARVPD